MQLSPRGREIQPVEGSASEIISRGSAIERIGEQMRESAGVLESIQSRASDQQGQAIDSLRESIGESYQVLHQAADLYEPVGPVIREYGDALADIQPRLNGHAADCEALWGTYVSLPGSVEPRGTGGWFQPEEGSEEAQEQAEQDAAKRQAYQAWEDEAQAFDTAYDSWEDAFDTAVSGISEEMADSIKDSTWDNVSGFFDVLGQVLSWAALIAGVAALIIGSSFLIAITAALAVAYLAVTAIQYANGDKTLLDVGLATLAILPVGKLGNLTKLLHGNMAAVKSFARHAISGITKLKGITAKPFFRTGTDSLIHIGRTHGSRAVFNKILTGNTGFNSVHRTHKQFYQGKYEALAKIRDSAKVRNLARGDQILSGLSNVFGQYGRATSASEAVPGPSLPKLPDWVRAF